MSNRELEELSERYRRFQSTWYEFREMVKDDFVLPSARFIQRVPRLLTNFKNEHVLTTDLNTRTFAHGIFASFVFFLSLRANRSVLRSARNTCFAYYGVGFLVVPELLSPYLEKIKNSQ
eukprot:TRINITY_DN9593_c0_g1_i2.p1 TRINITY_DN9593_c0_g1~~TRINITY_DN9593_c0_g1_i2.p1  ORF type:complete len:119 (-),score=18.90 TRINITY_DN9593_c0_g1_i2:120-476(-)